MEYPEHEEMKKVEEPSLTIGEFLEWLSAEGFIIGEWMGSPLIGFDKLVPVNLSSEKLLAKYFKIDLELIENEKRQMLDEMRKLNEKGE